MSGHSHWATIKNKKGAADAKRGKIFSKMSKNIMLAVKAGGADPTTNTALRDVLDKARAADMPKANIERAIKKMTGEGQNVTLEELTYEGFGPGGISILVDVVTDNRNRTAAEIRKLLENNGGKMGESGSVSYLFEKKGLITVPVSAIEEDKLMEIVLELGAENLSKVDEFYEITTSPTDFLAVRNGLKEKEIPMESSDLAKIPQTLMGLDNEKGKKALSVLSKLEDHDDAQNVYSNYKPSKEQLKEFEEAE